MSNIKSAVLEVLKELLVGESQEPIFCDPPQSSVIYVNMDRSHSDCFFHSYDKELKKHTPHPSCIHGRISQIEAAKIETDDGSVFKLRVTVKNGDQTVVIQSGLQTLCSRDLLWAVSCMQPEQLSKDVYIEAYIPDLTKFTQISDSKKSKLLSCRLYDSKGHVLYFEKPKESEADYQMIGKLAIEKVQEANGNA